jgi:hypothetical protein
MALKRTDVLFTVKEYLQKKLQRQKRSSVKNHRSSPLYQVLKKPVTQAKRQVVIGKRCTTEDANTSSKYAKNHCKAIRRIRDEISLGALWGRYRRGGGLLWYRARCTQGTLDCTQQQSAYSKKQCCKKKLTGHVRYVPQLTCTLYSMCMCISGCIEEYHIDNHMMVWYLIFTFFLVIFILFTLILTVSTSLPKIICLK